MVQAKKALFSDLDGTLLNDQKEIEESTRAAISGMLKQGHIFVLCTGRPLASAKRVAGQFGLDTPGCYIAAYNGGVLYDPVQDHIISYASIPLPYVHRMFAQAKAAGLYVQTYDRKDTVLANGYTKELDSYIQHTKLAPKAMGDVLEGLADPPAKMIVISHESHEDLRRFQEENAAWTAEVMNSFFSCEQYLEYCPAGISKGSAVRLLCEYLDIPLEHAVAVGDERNDCAMLQTAGIGAAPRQAHPQARACADYVCKKDNNEGAVGEVVRKFIDRGQ